ncbi:hypothetical protein LP420_35350 [Massilia sp. B-10]|nr:hypothetical protein LP420_35350 [Massilia sp. B-10]
MHTMFSKLDTDQAQHGLWFNTACTQVRQGNWHAAALSLSRLSAALRRHLRAEEAGLLTALADRLGQDNTSTAMLRVEHQQVLGGAGAHGRQPGRSRPQRLHEACLRRCGWSCSFTTRRRKRCIRPSAERGASLPPYQLSLSWYLLALVPVPPL